MQVKAGIELPRRVSCSSASSDTEAHSDCQKRRDTACIRVSQGGRDGLATTDLLKLKRGQDFRPRGRLKKSKPREQIGVPSKRGGPSRAPTPPNSLQTLSKRTQRRRARLRIPLRTQNPLNTSVVGLIIRDVVHRLADVRRVIGNCNTESLITNFQTNFVHIASLAAF